MDSQALADLARIGQIKTEPRNDAEIVRMLGMARTRLADAQLSNLSMEGRFTSAYNAAHRKRNLAEYEGYIELEEATIEELRRLADELITDVSAMTGL